MKRPFLPVLAAVAALGAASQCYAQHAGFVLFGEPNPEAAKATPEQRFVHPVTSPYFHEDSFVTTDIRLWYLYHDFPNSSTFGGGHAQVIAAQARLAITNQIQLVAYKDGYTFLDSPLSGEEGLNDIAAGLKWNFIQDFAHQFHMAAGVGYQLPAGDDEVFQDYDQWRFWASVNKGFDRIHLGATVNFFLTDDKHQRLGHSDELSWHLHGDYYVCEWFSPVVEINGYHVLNAGGEVVPFSGLDVTNLGGSSGDPVVTIGLGGEIRPPIKNLSLRAAYETPLTHEANDIFGWRITTSIVWGF